MDFLPYFLLWSPVFCSYLSGLQLESYCGTHDPLYTTFINSNYTYAGIFPVNKENKIPVIRLLCINWSTSRYHLVGNFGISVFILGNITKRKIKVSYRVVVCKRTDVLNVKIILLGVSFLYPITCLNTNSMQKYDFIMQTHIYK